MKTALVTGANKGIGFETAKYLLQQGYFVYLGSRDAASGAAAVTTL
ncbi:MAG TPA: SDR family NAD(P)-dependent oxidoreductase, partial [Chitinophaga sp.]